MANSHFGNLGDVWKHLVLAAVLEREPPRWYAETHAGSAAYPLNRDPQREFGIWRFLAAAPRSAELARSRYYAIAGSCASASPPSISGTSKASARIKRSGPALLDAFMATLQKN